MNLSKIIKTRAKDNTALKALRTETVGMTVSEAVDEGFHPFEVLWQNSTSTSSQYIKNAEEQATIIIDNAKKMAAQTEKDGYQKGYVQGEKEGKAAGKHKLEQTTQKINELLAVLKESIGEMHKQYGNDLLLLIKTIVDRLVHHEVSVNPRVIQSCLLETMDFVVENSVASVHLHDDDLNRLKKNGINQETLSQGLRRVQLVADPHITMGGCLISTNFGEIDATLETRREKLYEAVETAFITALKQ